MERAKLEEALQNVERTLNAGEFCMYSLDEYTLRALRDAAEKHLATLPKTKMVEVWRVEYAWRAGPRNPWFCLNQTFREKSNAMEGAANSGGFAKDGEAACIRVTGPHMQEIPA